MKDLEKYLKDMGAKKCAMVMTFQEDGKETISTNTFMVGHVEAIGLLSIGKNNIMQSGLE